MAVICRSCPWAPGRASSWGGAARLVGHSTEASSALTTTRRNDSSPGRTTEGSNAAVAVDTAGITMFGCDNMRDMKGSRCGWADTCGCTSTRLLPASLVIPRRTTPGCGVLVWGAEVWADREKAATGRRGAIRDNIQHPTSNIQHPIGRIRRFIGCWMLDVGCWMFLRPCERLGVMRLW